MGKRSHKTTIADVARFADVSVSSVSNVLNGRSDRMRAETCERIQSAIETLGYTPNVAARQLKTGHSPIIGLIVPSVANLYFGTFARYVEEAALSQGYQVLLGNSDRDPEREKRYAEELLAYGVRGIICGSSLTVFDHLESAIARGLHVVSFDRSPQENDHLIIDSFGVDNEQSIRLVVKHLISLGHRRIGLVSGPIRTVSRIARLAGYRLSLEEAGIAFDASLVWEGVTTKFGDTETVKIGREGAHALLSQANAPTAIIAMNDMHAFGVYAGARDLGLSIPEDLSVTGIDDIALAEVVGPPLTTIRQPIDEIARLAVDRLLARIKGNCKEEPEHRTLSPRLIVRESTGAVSSQGLSRRVSNNDFIENTVTR